MNCEEYITNYLSAHADGELTPEEERAVAQHLGSGPDDGCAVCRARLAEERLLKALIKRQAATVKTPEDSGRGSMPRSTGIDRGSCVATDRNRRGARTEPAAHVGTTRRGGDALRRGAAAGGILPGMHRGRGPPIATESARSRPARLSTRPCTVTRPSRPLFGPPCRRLAVGYRDGLWLGRHAGH